MEFTTTTSETNFMNVSWNSDHASVVLRKRFTELLEKQLFTDVTVSCNGGKVKCHKAMLYAGSKYFAEILKDEQSSNSTLILPNLKMWQMQAIVDFLYYGELKGIPEGQLKELFQVAAQLKIEGWPGVKTEEADEDDGGGSAKENSSDEDTKTSQESVDAPFESAISKGTPPDKIETNEMTSNTSGQQENAKEGDEKPQGSSCRKSTMEEDKETNITVFSGSGNERPIQMNMENIPQQPSEKKKRKHSAKGKIFPSSPVPMKLMKPGCKSMGEHSPARRASSNSGQNFTSGLPFHPSFYSEAGTTSWKPKDSESLLRKATAPTQVPAMDTNDLLKLLNYAATMVVTYGYALNYVSALCGLPEAVLLDYIRRINMVNALGASTGVHAADNPTSRLGVPSHSVAHPSMRSVPQSETGAAIDPSLFSMLPK